MAHRQSGGYKEEPGVAGSVDHVSTTPFHFNCLRIAQHYSNFVSEMGSHYREDQVRYCDSRL